MIVHNRLTSRVNGPGLRAVVWVEGCDLGCKNCWNSALWPQDKPDNETPQSLASWILAQPDIEGVTFSGGEPLQQAHDLYQTIFTVKHYRPDLSIGMFTGYNLDELEEGRFKFRTVHHLPHDLTNISESIWVDDALYASSVWRRIKSKIDFAVMGRFQDSRKTSADPMRSSTNQKMQLFSDRYEQSDFDMQKVEVRIAPGGLTTITGFPVGVKGL
jgi:anaerobic ribonucleoside-triphosphate reductase activating protein